MRKPIIGWGQQWTGGGTKRTGRPAGAHAGAPEHSLQSSLVDWHRRCVRREQQVPVGKGKKPTMVWVAQDPLAPLLIAIPNANRRSAAESSRLQAEGMRAGAADLALILLDGRVCWIECKLEESLHHDKTYQGPTQRAFQENVEVLGHLYVVIRSLEEYADLLAQLGVRAYARPMGGNWHMPAAPKISLPARPGWWHRLWARAAEPAPAPSADHPAS